MQGAKPGASEFVIIGGGAVGCGVAYALVEAGKRDILVLERAAELGSITTSQGAGLCGQVRDLGRSRAFGPALRRDISGVAEALGGQAGLA